MVPIYPNDTPLLAVQWAGGVFFNTCLPFGLRAVRKIFTAVADVHLGEGVLWVSHYLDDYITMGLPMCTQHGGDAVLLQEIGCASGHREMCKTIGDNCVPGLQAGYKVRKEGLPEGELESFLGHLQHAATVVRPGHMFI